MAARGARGARGGHPCEDMAEALSMPMRPLVAMCCGCRDGSRVDFALRYE